MTEPTLTEIPLTNSALVAIIDAADAPEILRYKWALDRNGYAIRYAYDSERGRARLMHRHLLGILHCDGRTVMVDHIDNNRLNNRRVNIRIVTNSINIQRARKRVSKYGYVGIHRNESRSKPFAAHIRLDGKSKWLGVFATPEEAARAYDAAALEAFGEHARINFHD